MLLRRRLAAAALVLAASLASAAPVLAQAGLPPLRTGVDGTFAPHAMAKLGGGIEGFQIDLFTEAARRMKREIVIDSTSFSGLIPGLQAGRYDFIAAPTTVTKERSENMLFTAGYLWTAFQFGIKKGNAPITGWADLKGKVVVMNIWATWCVPCVKEMPSLDRLQARIGKDKLVVIPLSLDGPTRAKVAPFYADKKLTSLGIWFDRSRKVMQALDVSILPTTILVDAKGRELGRLEGEADWDKPEAAALVSGALAG